jgi:hypothetical protein
MREYYENSKPAQELVNVYYVEISALMKGAKSKEIIKELLDDLKGSAE